MRWRMVPLFIVLLLAASCNQLCTPVQKCGDFSFSGTTFHNSSSNGANVSVNFSFNPGSCNSSCTCNPVCEVQIVRTVALDDSTYLYPSSEKQDRATDQGWYVDRLAGKIWGYYGRNNDGSFAPNLTPGSETSPTILTDAPNRPASAPYLHIWWQAVDAPVCIQANSGCANKLLGYYFWSWLVDSSGAVSGPVDAVAWDPLQSQVDAAVVKWNAQAPGLGKNVFPPLTRLAP